MKKVEIRKLLDFFDRGEPNSDFSGFADPVEARENYQNLNLIREKYSSIDMDFSPFFTESIMGRISQLAKRPMLEEYLSNLLSRVATYGFTALVLIIITLFFLQGQDGFGSILGTDSNNEVNFISSLFYEY